MFARTCGSKLRSKNSLFIFHHAKFGTKIIVSFSFVIGIAVICFLVFSQSLLFERFEAEATRNTLQLCIKISENIDTYIEKMDELTKRLHSDPDLLAVLDEVDAATMRPGTYQKLDYNRRLGEVVSNAVALSAFPYLDVNIFSRDGSYRYTYHQDTGHFSAIMQNQSLMDQLEQQKMVVYTAPGEEAARNGRLSFVRSIYDFRTNHYGYVEIQDDVSKLVEICNINGSGEVAVMDRSGKLLFRSGPAAPALADGLTESAYGHSGYFQNNDGEIIFYSNSAYSGLTVYVQYSQESVYATLIVMKNATFLLMVGVSLLCLLLVFLFTKRLVKPIQDLRSSVLGISYENMGLTIQSSDNNEIAMLGDAFQSILGKLKVSIDREIASGKAEMDARLSALQAQIAPHFIHNVLYAISITAREQRSQDVVTMCKQLSDMLRYTVNSSKEPVALREELAFVKSYLSLEARNYEDSLFFEISVSGELDALMVPRLSLQPFVENAVQHAFQKQKPPYRIWITGAVKESRWLIAISDNGGGITPGRQSVILQKIASGALPAAEEKGAIRPNAGMGGMGIANSVLRMKLLYGGDFQFAIQCPESGGTVIRMEGPLSVRGQEGQEGEDA